MMTVWSVKLHLDAHHLEEDGDWVAAQIVDKRAGTDKKSNRYYATVAYKVSGNRYEFERNVEKTFFDQHDLHASVDIKYWKQDPQTFDFIENQTKKSAQWRQGIALGIGILGLMIFWKAGSRTNSAVLARKGGRITTATIQSVVERTGQYGGKTGKGQMSFVTKDGVAGQSLERNIGNLLDLGVGTEIVVFVRNGEAWWEGDVGPRAKVPSQLPKVS